MQKLTQMAQPQIEQPQIEQPEVAWISEQMEQLRELLSKAKNETALKSYIACLMRLLNGLVQISVTPMHQYEKTILVKPMQVFCKYFTEQSKKIIEKTSVQGKENDIKDVEDAICAMASIYENVINGASNADKRMFMAMPINSTLYNVFPKLYAFYETIVGELTKLYSSKISEEQQGEYAFLLNPTIRNQLYTDILFRRRKDSGKVVIINMPVQFLEKGDDLLLYLLHEVFHVLTKEQRKRKKRADYLLGNLIQQLGIQIFDGVVFSEESDDDKIKAEILDKLVETIEMKYRQETDNRSEDDHFFYSHNIVKYFRELVVETFQGILNNWPGKMYMDLFEKFYLNKKGVRKEDFGVEIADFRKRMEQIRVNLLAILLNGSVSYLLKQLMYFYRECYADLACIWTSGYPIERYKKAFAASVRFKITDEQMKKDDYHKLRQILVKMALDEGEAQEGQEEQERQEGQDKDLYVGLSEEDSRSLRENADDAENVKDDERKSENDDGAENDDEEEDDKRDEIKLVITEGFLRSYLKYLRECKKSLEFSVSSEALRAFRKRVEKIGNMNMGMIYVTQI